MKKIFIITLFCLLAYPLSIKAQNAKKYALLEHFTNTPCGTCGATNPGFYSAVDIENNKNLHHISYHASTPYIACIYYQANKTEQDARSNYYSLPGVPRVSINGGATIGAGSVTATTITNAASGISPLQITVAETTNATGGTVVVKVKSVGTPPSGTHKLVVALVEKKTNYAAPNGETVHHNVFRKFLTIAADGADIVLPAQGIEVNFSYTYALTSGWVANQMYAVAFVQNSTTKAVVNSGTKFDVVSATEEASIDAQVSISPNPAKEKILFNF